jgi:hypothetical protein
VSAFARAQTPTLAGRWSASPLRSDWNIGDWGSACGPRPAESGSPAGTAIIARSGNELSIAFPDRTYLTNTCWEQFPGLTRTSHSSGARAFRTVCKTPAGDPRQATLVTTLSATDNQINFDETGQYQFVIHGQNCTASVRRTRVLTLIQREGEPEPAPASSTPKPAAAASSPAAPRARRCASVGLPERLEARPSRKLMRPGESFDFRAAVVDAAGCLLPIQPTWRVVSGDSSVQVSPQGKVTVADTAPESEVRLQAVVGDRAASVLLEIVSRERYESLLTQGNFNAQGESDDASIALVASSSIGARSAVTRDDARGKRFAFIAVVGGLSLTLGVLGLLILVRGRRARADTAGSAPAPRSKRRGAAPPGGMVCPTCREEFPAGSEFCAFDGNRLVPLLPDAPIGPAGGVCPICGQGYDPGVTVCPKHQEPLVPALVLADRQRAPTVARKICPVCGTQFPGDSQFCGKCGAALVPVN